MVDYPIVFIPGLFGSLGDDIIPGTGEFSFGLAESVYRPFIEILNSMGYIEGKDLFISYYDWKKPVLESVNKYLLEDIEKVLKKTNSKKVILIGHSLGGLLGRAYINYFKPSFIDKLIMIGTPNLGSVNAYYFWSGGQLPYPQVENNILYSGIKAGFILYFRLFHSIDYIDAARNIFPVARDLLPSNKYGNYLVLEENGIREEISIEDMYVRNPFLNLMEGKDLGTRNIFTVSGKGVDTKEQILVHIKDRKRSKWKDGKPIKSYKTLDGDGTVTTTSSLGYLGHSSVVLKGNHIDILYKSKDYLSSTLNRPLLREVKEKKVEKVYIALAQYCEEINIRTSKDNYISSQGINIMDNRVQAIDLNNNNFLIMAAGDKNLEVQLDIQEIKGVEARVHMYLMEEGEYREV